MAQYKVRTGQNIYDVALTLYGSVEGIFSLLASNDWLTMETKLTYGMVIEYSENLAINNDIVLWLRENNIVVKNGEHIYNHLEIEDFIQQHIHSLHPNISNELLQMSPDEQNMYWESLYTPRMVIQQQGQTSTIRLILSNDTHLIIDWGDYSDPQIIEGSQEQEVEHCYKGSGNHLITLYGDFECKMLDFTELNGIYYPLGTIYADEFKTALHINDLNKLIIPT